MNDEKPVVITDEAEMQAESIEEAVTKAQAKGLISLKQLAAAQDTGRRTALREFKEWKKALIDIIKRESTISWAVRDGKLTYSFVLPPKLVKIVWNTTIKERIKLEAMKQQAGSAERAVSSIRNEVNTAVQAAIEANGTSQKDKDKEAAILEESNL